jgi:hypothetical protein
VAQGDSDSIGCRFVVDRAVKAETIAHQMDAATVCVLKAT